MKKRDISKSYIIDIVLISILIVAMIIDYFAVDFKIIFDAKAFDIIISLLPLSITIISLGIQMQNEKYGSITLIEFNKLRSKHRYTILHMLFVVLAIFVFMTIFKILGTFTFSILVLDIISIFYFIVFILYEVPILMRDDKRFYFILRNNLEGSNSTKDILTKNINQLLFNEIVNRGFVEVIECLNDGEKYNETTTIPKVLEIIYLYLNEIDISIEDFKSNPNKLICGKGICETCCQLLNEITNFLHVSRDDSISFNLLEKPKEHLYLISRPIFALHRIMSKLSFLESFNCYLSQSINSIELQRLGKIDYSTIDAFLLLMSVTTVLNGETWFVEKIRDVNLSHYYYDYRHNDLECFLNMYFCFVINNDLLTGKTKTNIDKFVNSPCESINGPSSSWKKKAYDGFLHSFKPDFCFDYLNSLLDVFHLIDSGYFTYYPTRNIFTITGNNTFTKETIVDYWLQQIIFSKNFYISKDSFKDLFSNIDHSLKEIIYSTFTSRWLNFDFTLKDRDYHFGTYFYGSSNINYPGVKERIDYLKELVNGFAISNRNIKPILKKDLENIKEIIDSRLIKDISESSIYHIGNFDSPIDKQCLLFLLKDYNDQSNGLNIFLDSVADSLNIYVRKYISNNSNVLSISDYVLSEDEIKKIETFKPDFSGERTYLIHQTNITDLKKLALPYLPRDFYFKNDALFIDIKYDKHESQPRKLTEYEINDIIDKEFLSTDGLYVCNFSRSSAKYGYLLSRKELFDEISNTYYMIPLVFDIKIKVLKEKTLLLKLDTHK